MKVDYQKMLKKVIKDYGHNIDKIMEFVEQLSIEVRKKIAIPFKDIVNNDEWTVEEKVILFKCFEYNEKQQYLECEEVVDGEFVNKNIIAECYTIKYDDIVSFEALMQIFDNVRRYESTDKVYKDIFKYICANCNSERRIDFLEVFFKYISKEEIERLLKTEYYASSLDSLHDTSMMIDIIASLDIDLIKKYIDYVDVNTYFNYAVATGNIEIVKIFLDKGADVNYVPEEVILGVLSPLKTAIGNNDFEMVKYLVENGAKVDLQVIDEDFNTKICYYKSSIYGDWKLLYKGKGWEGAYNERDEKRLKEIRILTPLEFATKTSEDKIIKNSSGYNVRFDGARLDSDNYINVDRSYDENNDKLRARINIVNYLLDLTPDKTKIHYDELLIFSFIANDVNSFDKYVKLIDDNKFVFGMAKIYDLMKYFFIFNMTANKDMTASFIDFLGKCSNNNDDIYVMFFKKYLEYLKRTNCYSNYFRMTDFARTLLNKIDIEKRKEIIVVPYCRDIHSVSKLVELGFDINQVNENGENILINLMSRKSDLQDYEVELFDILLYNVTLTHKDKDGKTALYYAMMNFPTSREFEHGRVTGTISKMETCAVELIKRMPKEEVCSEDIKTILDERMNYRGNYGDHIDNLYVWKHHKDLYTALINRGFVLSDVVLEDIFDSLYSEDDQTMENIKSRIDYDETLKFVFSKLDHNTGMQNIDIVGMYDSLRSSLDRDISYVEFRTELINFGDNVGYLKEFYNENILKKYNPERYMEYIKEQTGAIYNGIDEMLLDIIIRTLSKFGGDKLSDILSNISAFNLNTIVKEENVGLIYWRYVEMVSDMIGVDDKAEPIYGDEHFEADHVYPDYDDYIKFTGGLMQYAILTDNVEMAKLLLDKGVSFAFFTGDEDRTWDYVNSKTMLELMETTLGYKKEDAFNPDEYALYLKLKGNKEDNNKKDN